MLRHRYPPNDTFFFRTMKKILLIAPLFALLAGCGSIPKGADRLNMITAEEAEANGCKLLDKAGSVSVILVNGSKPPSPGRHARGLHEGEARHYERSHVHLGLPESRSQDEGSQGRGLAEGIPRSRLNNPLPTAVARSDGASVSENPPR